MFDKFQKGKQLLKMRQQAKALQSQMEKILHSEEKGKVRVVVNGIQQITYMEIEGEERKDLVDLINKALKEVQKKSAKKMLEMGEGLGLLSGLSH